MEIRSFLLPKSDVAYISSTASMLEALELLEIHAYSAIPIIDAQGKYVGTLSEGDLLWKLKHNPQLNFSNIDQIAVKDIKKRIFNECVSLNEQMEDMLTLAADQNFVPVVDDEGIFLGIIRRKDIIAYYNQNITD